jgi:hypothetical protein
MSQTDPLLRLLQDADAATNRQAPVDLVGKVHRRQQARATKSRRLTVGAIGICMATALVVSLNLWRAENQLAVHPLAEPRANAIAPIDIEALLRESKSLKAEADALEQLIAAQQRSARLAELAAEHDRLLVSTSAPDPEETALERAAAKAVCQADFLLETLNDRIAATQAYRHVAEQFPDTRWAMIAQDNLIRLEMN